MLFGALTSPTDPMAVLGVLKAEKAPKKFETKIIGESHFNDGVGVMVFILLFKIAEQGLYSISSIDVVLLFVTEVV